VDSNPRSPGRRTTFFEPAPVDLAFRCREGVRGFDAQPCRKSLAERVDANDRAFRASRWRRGSPSLRTGEAAHAFGAEDPLYFLGNVRVLASIAVPLMIPSRIAA